MMLSRVECYLEKANGAIARGDYLTAMQFGALAAGVPSGSHLLRCDAQLVAALATLEMGMGETALAYAVGAQLLACRTGDTQRETRAAGIVMLILAEHPHLRCEDGTLRCH